MSSLRNKKSINNFWLQKCTLSEAVQIVTYSSLRSWTSNSLALRSCSRSRSESSYMSCSSSNSRFFDVASAITLRLASAVPPEKKPVPNHGNRRDLIMLAPPYKPPATKILIIAQLQIMKGGIFKVSLLDTCI